METGPVLLKRSDPFAIVGILAVLAVAVVALSVSTTNTTVRPVVVRSGHLVKYLHLDEQGRRHGICEHYVDGVLTRRQLSHHGQWVWIKEYWPQGTVKMHRYERWNYDVVEDHYTPEGNLIDTLERWKTPPTSSPR